MLGMETATPIEMTKHAETMMMAPTVPLFPDAALGTPTSSPPLPSGVEDTTYALSLLFIYQLTQTCEKSCGVIIGEFVKLNVFIK